MKLFFKSLTFIVFLLIAGKANGITYPYQITAEKAIVYADTTANAKQLGKMNYKNEICIFSIEGNWAKTRYKQKWAYVKAADIAFAPDSQWEVVTKKGIVYENADGKKRIGTVKKGTIITVADRETWDAQYGHYIRFSYTDKQKGFIHVADLQPLPIYWEVVAKPYAVRYKTQNTSDIDSSTDELEELKTGEIIAMNRSLRYVDKKIRGQYEKINDEWARGNRIFWESSYYIQFKDLVALPDSVAADRMDSVFRKYETRKSLSFLPVVFLCVLAILYIILLALIEKADSERKAIKRKFWLIYSIALFPLLMGAVFDKEMIGIDLTFGKQGFLGFVIEGVCNIAIGSVILIFAARVWKYIKDCYQFIKCKKNTFLAVLAVFFPVQFCLGIFVASVVIVSIWVIMFGIILLFMSGMAFGKGSESSSSASAEKTIYGPDGNKMSVTGSTAWDSQGNSMTEGVGGIWHSSNGKDYRMVSRGGGRNEFEEVGY